MLGFRLFWTLPKSAFPMRHASSAVARCKSLTSLEPPHCRSSSTCKRTCTLQSVGLRNQLSASTRIRHSTKASMTDEIVVHELMQAQRVPCLSDNYAWVLTESETGKTAVVDPSEAKPVLHALDKRGLKLDFILNTHHHNDHTGGNLELKEHFGCQIIGPKADKDRIPGIDVALADGDVWQFGGLQMHVFDTPGHTRGHITLWFPKAEALFPGDTLFVLGCGRLFEGSPQQMWHSLSKMTSLPPETRVFCAHEYTQSNARFAMHADPHNAAMQERQKQIDDMRSQGLATVPSLLGQELKLNPFLRPSDPAVRTALGISSNASDEEAFAAIRRAKDKF